MTREEILSIAYSIGTVGEPWWLDDEDLMAFVTAIAPRLALKPGEPVAWGMPRSDGAVIDCITPEEHDREQGGYTVPLYAAPQPQPDEHVDCPRCGHCCPDDTALLRQCLDALNHINVTERADIIKTLKERLK